MPSNPQLAALTLLIAPLLATALVGCDKKTSTAPPAQIATEAQRTPDAPSPTLSAWKASDTHTHLSPAAYPLAIKAMDESRIFRVVNMSGSSTPKFRRANLHAADAHPERIALFFNLNWQIVNAPNFGEKMAKELDSAVRAGYAGVKISKHLGLGARDADGKLIAIDDPRFDPVWARAGELGVPVGIHTSDPKAFFEEPTPENERWDELKLAPSWSFYGDEYPSRRELLDARNRVVAKHPDTTFILLHLANNPEDLDAVDALLDTYPNVKVDVAARLAEIGRHPVKKVQKFFTKHQDRVVFATDLSIQARPTPEGLQYRVTLGSVSAEPPTLDDIAGFYSQHWRYFESDEDAIEHPIPIQGRWKIKPIQLDKKIRDKIYLSNGERLIFGPWLGRRAGRLVAANAKQFATPRDPESP